MNVLYELFQIKPITSSHISHKMPTISRFASQMPPTKPRHSLLYNYWSMLLIAFIQAGLIEV